MTREQLVRDILEQGIELLENTGEATGGDPQRLTAGDLVSLSLMVRRHVLEALDNQPALPGMERTPPRAPEPRAPYDDTARGYVGVAHAGTEASKDAAVKMLAKVEKQRRRVLDHLRVAGWTGKTADEVSAELNIPTTSAGPRLFELREAGQAVKVADRRKTRAGGTAQVNVAIEYSAELRSRAAV